MKYSIKKIPVLFFFIIACYNVYSLALETETNIKCHGIRAKKTVVMSDKSIVIIGNCEGGYSSIGDHNLTSSETGSSFIAKLDSTMKVLWIKQLHGEYVRKTTKKVKSGSGYTTLYRMFGRLHTRDIVVDSNNNIIISGSFSGKLYFDDELVLKLGFILHDRQSFVMKISENGALIWARKVVLNEFSWIHGMCLDRNDNVYLTGSFERGLTYSSFKNNLTYNRTNNMFACKYSSNGKKKWFRKFKSKNFNSGVDIACLNDKVYILGYFLNEFIFSKDKILVSSLDYSARYNGVFIAKLSTRDGGKENIVQTNLKFINFFDSYTTNFKPIDQLELDLTIFSANDRIFVTGTKAQSYYQKGDDLDYWINPEQVLLCINEKLELETEDLVQDQLFNISVAEDDLIFKSYVYYFMHGIIKDNRVFFSRKLRNEDGYWIGSALKDGYYYSVSLEYSDSNFVDSRLYLRKYKLTN